MARDSSKEGRGEHRSERDRSDRSATTGPGGRVKDKESGGGARDRARSTSKEDSSPVVKKRLRNEGESKGQSSSPSSKMEVSTSPSKVSSSSTRPPSSSTTFSTSPTRAPQNPILEGATEEPLPSINKKELYEVSHKYKCNVLIL
jgi:hypothetical protein